MSIKAKIYGYKKHIANVSYRHLKKSLNQMDC